ncbi:Elongator complex protein 2 [Platanthera guangdongensis]|uniref:Elongator complex protein 2 n=1 Tax=Platanthera guangdongensis TaxID=2320717 RepID=A0ABR2M3K8_9ASPA
MVATHVEGGDVEVERLFIGAGCNRVVNNVSWGPSGLVAFGAQNAVAIFCPEANNDKVLIPIFFVRSWWLSPLTSNPAYAAAVTTPQYLDNLPLILATTFEISP